MRMTTEEAFVKVLQMHGIEHAFGIIGSALMPISDLFPKAGITFWDVAHESNGGHHGRRLHARRPARWRCALPRTGRASPTSSRRSKTAYWNHTPMLLVTPQAANSTIGQGGFQEVEQMALLPRHGLLPGGGARPVAHRGSAEPRHLQGQSPVGAGSDQRAARITGRRSSISACRRSSSSSVRPGAPRRSRRRRGCCRRRSSRSILSAPAWCSPTRSRTAPPWQRSSTRRSAPTTSTTTASRHRTGWPWARSATTDRRQPWSSSPRPTWSWRSGTRLNPFSTLPGYGIDYWPKQAKIIQVDINADRIGLTKPVAVGICGDAGLVARPSWLSCRRTRVMRDARSARRSSTRAVRLGCSSSPRWITRMTIPARPGTTARARGSLGIPLVLGAGQVGSYVAESLVCEANDITVVDTDAERLNPLQDRLDLRTVVGNAAHPSDAGAGRHARCRHAAGGDAKRRSQPGGLQAGRQPVQHPDQDRAHPRRRLPGAPGDVLARIILRRFLHLPGADPHRLHRQADRVSRGAAGAGICRRARVSLVAVRAFEAARWWASRCRLSAHAHAASRYARGGHFPPGQPDHSRRATR